MLTDWQLAKYCERGMITPFVDRKVNEYTYPLTGETVKIPSYGLSQAGYDIRLGSKFRAPLSGAKIIDPMHIHDTEWATFSNNLPFLLKSHSYILGVSMEEFDIPDNITGIATGKSTYARCGVQCIVTPLESGWKGFLTIEIVNNSDQHVVIYPYAGIVQINFYEHEVVTNPYDGKYQNQVEEPTLAR